MKTCTPRIPHYEPAEAGKQTIVKNILLSIQPQCGILRG